MLSVAWSVEEHDAVVEILRATGRTTDYPSILFAAEVAERCLAAQKEQTPTPARLDVCVRTAARFERKTSRFALAPGGYFATSRCHVWTGLCPLPAVHGRCTPSALREAAPAPRVRRDEAVLVRVRHALPVEPGERQAGARAKPGSRCCTVQGGAGSRQVAGTAKTVHRSSEGGQ